ncbi:cysteine-rich secretory family protein [Peptostreptococcaceae bacterium AS15]|nr:SCP-like protein [[Eubacterium] yurii subsp. margaretiae ATCC 43715]EJP18521.1 cysteine-rich secretory family protein [Peptostreptococcaceae bacterium AS15]
MFTKRLIILLCITSLFVNTFWNDGVYAVPNNKKKIDVAKVEDKKKVRIKVNGKIKEVVVTFDKDMAKEMFDDINDYRKQNGVEPLAWNYGLSKGAQLRAVEIAYKFDHKRPNGKEWYTADEKNMFAENVGKKFKDADGMVDSWLGSASHKANILNKDMKSANIVVYNCDGVNYAVNSFSIYEKYKK